MAFRIQSYYGGTILTIKNSNQNSATIVTLYTKCQVIDCVSKAVILTIKNTITKISSKRKVVIVTAKRIVSIMTWIE